MQLLSMQLSPSFVLEGTQKLKFLLWR